MQDVPVDIGEWIDRDLTAEAAEGLLPPAFDAAEVIAQAEEVLAASGKRSVVLTGPPGVGKTAIVQELVRRAHAGSGAEALRGARVLQLSLRTVSVRFTEKGDATTFFGELCNAIVASPVPIVPFIRDIHLAYTLDWEPLVNRLVANLPRPILAEAPVREFEQLIEYWSDLNRYLVAIPVDEPPLARVRKIVEQWCTWRRQLGDPEVTPIAQRTAVELTARFMGDKPNPRKALDLLRETLDFHPAGSDAVGIRSVVRRFSQVTHVPTRLVDPDERLDLREVHDFVSERLLGQEQAVDAVVRMIALIKAGLADLRRPFGAFLFAGPTGVGKTHCAQLLAEYLFGDRERMVRINMAEYDHEHSGLLLFGNPHGQTIRDQRGVLATRLAGHPFGVLLLDELEKASRGVHDALLQLIDEGRFVNGRSETVSVTSMIVIATTNTGAEVYRQAGLGFDLGRDLPELDREVDRHLDRAFRFEFLNRFDRVVHFHPLERSNIRAIARRELAGLSQRDGLVSRELTVEVDAEVLDWLVAHGYHPHFGARFLRREIERNVAAVLAEFLVRDQPPRGSRLGLGVRRGRIDARLVFTPDQRLAVSLPDVAGPPREVKLDRHALLAEAQAWVARWEGLRRESEERQALAARLIDASTKRGFWDDAEHAQEVLRRFKGLDARIMADQRLLRPVLRLARLVEHPEEGTSEQLAGLVQEAALNYRRWLDIGASEQPTAAWLVLASADTLDGAGEWLSDLVAMYRGWLRRQGYTYDLVAEEVHNGEVQRVVFEVEGPGITSVLAMESGEHRRRQQEGRIDRALVELIPRQAPTAADDPPGATIEDARRTRGVAISRRTARLKIAVPERGIKLTLHGNGRENLQALAHDLLPALVVPPEIEVARTYGITGGTVRDPRTGASSASVKEVLRGNLDPFLRAWLMR